MAIFPGANVACSIGTRHASRGTPEADVLVAGTEGDWVGYLLQNNLWVDGPHDLCQFRVATVPAGETDAGRKYFGISPGYVTDHQTTHLLTAAQFTEYEQRATLLNTEYGGGATGVNPGWRFVFAPPRGYFPTYYCRFASGSRNIGVSPSGGRTPVTLFGFTTPDFPPLYLEKVVAARIQFETYRNNENTVTLSSRGFAWPRLAAAEIVEHRLFFVTEDNTPYNLPLAVSMEEDVSWGRATPWMRGVPGPDNVALGPDTPITDLRLDVSEVGVLPATEDPQEGRETRRLRLGRGGRGGRGGEDTGFGISRYGSNRVETPYGVNVTAREVPTYARNGIILVSGRLALIGSETIEDLDGLWTVDGEVGYQLVDADRIGLLEYDVLLERKLRFAERTIVQGPSITLPPVSAPNGGSG